MLKPLTSKHTVPHSKCLQIPSPSMCKMPPVCYKLNSLTYSATLSSKPSSVRKWKNKLGKFLRELPPSFPGLSEMFMRTICLFGSEKLFSTMKFNKSKYRSRLSDVHLQAILRVSTATSLRANVAQLSEKKHC